MHARPRLLSILSRGLLLAGLVIAAAPATSAPLNQAAGPVYTLPQLLLLARKGYPGIEAARQAIAAVEGQLFQARWAWIPQATVTGLVAPAPGVHCKSADGVEKDEAGNLVLKPNAIPCVETTSVDINQFVIEGIMGRIGIEAAMPLYTFDKLSSAKRAARAGVEAKRAQLEVTEQQVARDVTRAYWGLKLAREILFTIREGQDYLAKGQQQVEKEIESGEGDATETDLLRLKTAAAEIDVRVHEAKKLETLALASLATLTGQRGRPFQVDSEVLAAIEGRTGKLDEYLRLAHERRPEVQALQAATRVRQAAVDLEKARFYPDFFLVAMANYGAASSVDDPNNAFYSDPFNFYGAGFGLALRWKWDQLQQLGKLRTARAEMRGTEAQRREAILGMDLEVEKTLTELREARDRMASTQQGQKAARSWLVATVQNLEAGLSTPRDLVDSLVAYFQLRLRYLQAIYDVNVGWHELARVSGTPGLAAGGK